MTGKSTILLVEDTVESLGLLVATLKNEGFNVCTADSGELALVSVAAAPPALILLDVRMPGMDGLEVCRRLKARQETRHIPVILISAITELPEQIEGFRLGAVDFISKPFQREEALARVRTHLELSRLRNVAEQRAAALDAANKELREALANANALRGLLPICSNCKKIRDDKGYWSQIDAYFSAHADVRFTHGLCPACIGKFFPDYPGTKDIPDPEQDSGPQK